MEKDSDWFKEEIKEIQTRLEKLIKAVEELTEEKDDKERDYGI